MSKVAVDRHRSSPAREVEMKNRCPVRSVRALAPAELLFLLGLLIPGSAALSQPFPSFMLDTSLTRMPGFDDVNGTRAAFGPDLGLVVWNSRGVRGVRVDRTSGALLDSLQIEISGPDIGGGSRKPGVAWSGYNFLVAWAGYHSAACAMVEPDGRVTSRAVFQDSTVDGRGAAVAFDGTNFLVTWIAAPDTLGLTAYFCRVSPQGVILDSPPRMVAPLAAGRQISIALCFYGDRYLATWNDWDTIGVSGNFIMPDGSIDDSAGFNIRHGIYAGDPAVTHDRNNFLVSWDEWANRYFVKLARVSDSGAVLDTAGVTIDSFSFAETEVVSNGDTTLFLFRHDTLDSRDSLTLVAVRVDSALNHLDAEPVKLSAPGYPGYGYAAEGYAAALCGDDYFITWTQPLSKDPIEDWRQALCRRVSRNGELLDSTPAFLSYGTDVQEYPCVASDGEDFLAVWSDLRRDSVTFVYSLFGARFAADGTLLDTRPIWLEDSEGKPTVACGANTYLAVWSDVDEVLAKRITPDGIVLDSVPLRMPEPGWPRRSANVAFGDSCFLVAWASESGLRGCRITPDGTLLDTTPLQLAVDQAHNPRFPQVAFDGANFLVARHDGDDMHRCVRVGPDGAILDTADITLGPAGSVYDDATPEVAYGNSVYLVTDNVTSGCWLVTSSGKLLGAVPHADLQYAHVVFDGTDFMLLCQSRDTAGEWTGSLGAMRITPDGRVLDSIPFTLVTADSAVAGARYAAMSANGAGRVGVVFTGYERSPYLTSRIRAATFRAIVGIGSQRDAAPPAVFRVQPNPASRVVSLSFNLTQAGPVQVSAFDAAGRRCASLFSGRMKAGGQTIPLDTRRLANGIYFLRLEAGTATHSTRLVVAR
jgi:hypothetical protein